MIWLNEAFFQFLHFPRNEVASTLFPELQLVRKYKIINSLFSIFKTQTRNDKKLNNFWI